MIIFLKDIPLDTKKSELLVFVEPILNECFMETPSFKLSLLYVEILTIDDISLGRLEKHALIRVSPSELARQLINRINGKLFKNSPLAAREYVIRSTLNDRRKPGLSVAPDILERRVGERRRVAVMSSSQRNPIKVERVQI